MVPLRLFVQIANCVSAPRFPIVEEKNEDNWPTRLLPPIFTEVTRLFVQETPSNDEQPSKRPVPEHDQLSEELVRAFLNAQSAAPSAYLVSHVASVPAVSWV